jgi:methyl-CpG-binding domain protein 4
MLIPASGQRGHGERARRDAPFVNGELENAEFTSMPSSMPSSCVTRSMVKQERVIKESSPISTAILPRKRRSGWKQDGVERRQALYATAKSNKNKKKPPPGTMSGHRTPTIHAQTFGIIQERVAHNLYHLLIAAMLWNRTKGIHARPVFFSLIARYPTPEALALATEEDLQSLIRPLGLQNTRARRCLAFAKTWAQEPPTRSRRYRKLHYPVPGAGSDVGKEEVLDEDDAREGWEIAHLPAIGPYALDSFRIFHRDEMRGLARDWIGAGAVEGFEPEWKRVVPLDKELRACLRWMWMKEGWIWDAETGVRIKADAGVLRAERLRERSLSPGVPFGPRGALDTIKFEVQDANVESE